MYKRNCIFISAVIAVLMASGAAMAEKPRLFGDTPDPKELAKFLFPEASSTENATTRSWIVEDTPAPVAALQIQFEFDSTEFKPSSLQTVERLAQALITEEAGSEPVMIEGHTDAVGTEAYNLDLSKRRALAVREYLIDVYRIEPARLFTDGRGELMLLEPESPKAAVNRRVQVKRFNKDELVRSE